ncbi:MAG: gamma carbonic anhydrase family protein [Oscillospiraceae bacterium]
MDKPKIHPEAKIAPGAVVTGQAVLKKGVNIWYNAVIRADLEPIVLGENTNLQDCCVMHVSRGCPTDIGSHVTIGHSAILHGCTVGDNTLIGMGAIIMDKAVIGKNCIVAAGAVVVGGTVVPDGSLVMGAPAKVKRETTEAECKANFETAVHYIEAAAEEL